MSETLFTPQNIGTVLLGVVYCADKGRQYWLQRKYGLKSNPKRCDDHTRAINEIKSDIKEIWASVDRIKDKLDIV
jgi:hypothetical protein